MPKASRRLARKAGVELRRGRLGYVRLSVAAYGDLLDALPPGDASLLAREVVEGPPVRGGGA